MTDKTFKLIHAIVDAGLSNDGWGVVENANTKPYFGINESIRLNGKFLWIFRNTEDFREVLDTITPTLVIRTDDDFIIDIYELD